MNEAFNWRTEIFPILEQIKNTGVNVDILKKLFIERLNFEPAEQEVSPEILDKFPKDVKDKILSIKIISKVDNFKVIFCVIDSLLKGIERKAVKSISSYYLENIIVFTNKEGSETHFINTKYIKKDKKPEARGFRRITVGKTDRLRTAAERLLKIYAYDGISSLTLTSNCEKAFDVEAVSKEFYKEFVEKYKELRDVIRKNNPSFKKEDADKFTQEIMNRLLFLYFIQKKGWLNDDYKFLYNNFKSNPKNYYKNFLIPLFKKLSTKDFNHQEFENIPFLNGGLFEFSKIEEKISIPNKAFNNIYEDLLERFNFTIREDNELEEEVAIDPEMLGKIFEELILSIEAEKYKDIPNPRRASGSYYTPRFIVSFMTKQSLLNYLINELPEIPEDIFKSFIYNLTADGIDRPEIIKEKLLNLKIVDPGVGSGAFPVDILNKLVALIEILNGKIGVTESRHNLRKKLIEDCIYGVDIQERAVHLARLRLWLSLIVDLEVESIKNIPPLINLDFKILKGDSLVSKICGFKFDIKTPLSGQRKKTPIEIQDLISTFYKLKLRYAEVVKDEEKLILKKKINKKRCDIAIWHLENVKYSLKDKLKAVGSQLTWIKKTQKENKEEERKREILKREILSIEKKIEGIKNGKEIDAFNWYLDFFEVMGAKGGFDIVIANPPYGVSVDKEIYKNEFKLDSSDSYGVFTALGLNILKQGGTLCYIMSDTWQTIKTHYKLRKKLFEGTKAQCLISVPMKSFKATVNTGIYLFRKSTPEKEKDNFLIAADFHGLDIKNGDLEAALDLIVDVKPNDKIKDGYTIDSDREIAIYDYRQEIIKKFSNLSFFIASPKLFKLMDDTSNVVLSALPIMKTNFNGKEIELVKLENIVEDICAGVMGAKRFFKSDHGEQGCPKIDPSLICSRKLTRDEMKKGVRLINERTPHYVKFEKGGKTIINNYIITNYYHYSPFYIKWDRKTVRELKKNNQLRNQNRYFSEGIAFTSAGIYSPVFRLLNFQIFEKGLHIIFPKSDVNIFFLTGILPSKLQIYITKSYINHSVNTNTQDIEKIKILNCSGNRKISELVYSIITKQKQNPKYDYIINEQIEIDKLVYEMYNLNEDDIQEVENWYFRRYPKLAKVIEEKIKEKNKGE